MLYFRNTQTKKIQIEIENALEKYDADKMATIGNKINEIKNINI